MPLIAPAYVTVNPSFTAPEIIIQYNQASGAFDLLPESEPKVQLEPDDLYVYKRALSIRTKTAAGTAEFNELPGVTLTFKQISTPTYRYQVAWQFNASDTRAAGRWGIGLPDAYRKGGRQANFQLARDALLYGFNPQNGEGILNAPGATLVNLPPDTNGNSTVATYDNGQMAFFLSQQFANLKTRTLQLGIGQEFTLLGPQRVLGLLEYNVVQVTQFQRPGAGTTSTAGTVKEILLANGDTLKWAYDDTLIGKGANGADAIVLAMPQVEKPNGGSINTNEFAGVNPGDPHCLCMYADMGAPREIISPLARGVTDVLQEWRTTSGWAIRPEAVTIISMIFQ